MFASGKSKASSAMSSAMSSGSRDWSRLPGDVWYMIGLKLDVPSDRIRFRAVSKSLRSTIPYRQPPCLMLVEYHDDSDDDEYDIKCAECNKDPPPPQRRFFILGEQKRYYKFDLPQAHLARCVGSTGNWVITVKLDNIIRLLNPFSKLEIQLPDGLDFGSPRYDLKLRGDPPDDFNGKKCWRDLFLRKVIISPISPSNSNGIPSEFLVIALHNEGVMAMARPCDSSWTTFIFDGTTMFNRAVQEVIVYNGLLYAITSRGVLLSSDFLNSYPEPPQLTRVQQFDLFPVQNDLEIKYLVEWCGHLLFVIKYINMFGLDKNYSFETIPFYKTETFRIFQIDFTNRNWIEIKSLGEYSLFLGYNTSVSVLASDYFGSIEKNCIYFTDDFWFGFYGFGTPGGYDMGVFNLEDNSIKPHYTGTSTCFSSPPIWIVPD